MDRKFRSRFDLVLQARAKLSNNTASGLADAVVSEMIKALPLEKIHVVTKCFQQRLWAPWSCQIRGELFNYFS